MCDISYSKVLSLINVFMIAKLRGEKLAPENFEPKKNYELKLFKNIKLLRTPMNGYVLSTKRTRITQIRERTKKYTKFYTKFLYAVSYDITCSTHTLLASGTG